MEELNADLEGLDDDVETYLIRDKEEVQLKTRVWEEMNKTFLEEQAARQAAREEAEREREERGEVLGPAEGADGERRRPSKKRSRKGDGGSKAGSAAEAVESIDGGRRGDDEGPFAAASALQTYDSVLHYRWRPCASDL